MVNHEDKTGLKQNLTLLNSHVNIIPIYRESKITLKNQNDNVQDNFVEIENVLNIKRRVLRNISLDFS